MFKGSFNNLKKVKWTIISYQSEESAEFNFNNIRRIKSNQHIEMKLEGSYIKLLSDNIHHLRFKPESFGKGVINTIYSEL